MGISDLVTVLLLIQFIPLVQSIDNDVAETTSIGNNTAYFTGLECISRTLLPSSTVDSTNLFPDSTNITTVDDDFGNEDESTITQRIPPSYCPDGYFCDISGNKNKFTSYEVLGICMACTGSSDKCVSSPAVTESTTGPEFLAYTLDKAVAQECQEQCGAGKNACSSTTECLPGLFCNFEDAEEGGYCEGCPGHVHNCANPIVGKKNLTSQGQNACESSCLIICQNRADLRIITPATAKTTDKTTSSPIYIEDLEDVVSIFGSPQISATGPIVDCGLGLEPCEGAEGSICFIERGKAPFANKTINCHAGGGIATVFYNLETNCDNIVGSFGQAVTYIPTVALTHVDGKRILNEAKAMSPETPLLATVQVGGGYEINLPEEKCYQTCNEYHECDDETKTCDFDSGDYGECVEPELIKTPCNDERSFNGATWTEHLQCTGEREYCDFSLGKRGFCRQCGESASSCFFSALDSKTFNLVAQGAKECILACTDGSSDTFESARCKFCPKGSFKIGQVSDGFESTKTAEVTTPCEFCAPASQSTTCSKDGEGKWDMKYPNRTIRLYGGDIKCWAVAEFYKSLNIEASSTECLSARSLNYICGCSDTSGYAGADSEAKMKGLTWFPRVGAILSILGSSLMIVGVLQDRQKRKKVIGELIIFLCAFDIIGSLGFAFTSYPTPKEDYVHGAEGNKASCRAQGFFIQIGTISMYINVSIAFYYLLIIQFSWREQRLRKSRIYYMLFAVPILVGSIFAIAGIPFYDNAMLWCNNSGYYWSEIPVAIGIFIATVVMINLCWFVYKSERASRRFRRHSTGQTSVSAAFLKQSMVYLGAFFLTWPPYLALQIMLANGQAYSNYGFFLFAGTAVTLQGFWYYVFHLGMNSRAIGKSISSAVKTHTTKFSVSRSLRKSSRNPNHSGEAPDASSTDVP